MPPPRPLTDLPRGLDDVNSLVDERSEVGGAAEVDARSDGVVRLQHVLEPAAVALEWEYGIRPTEIPRRESRTWRQSVSHDHDCVHICLALATNCHHCPV